MSHFVSHPFVTEDSICIVFGDTYNFPAISLQKKFSDLDTQVMMDSNMCTERFIGCVTRTQWGTELTGTLVMTREQLNTLDEYMFNELNQELDKDFDYTFIQLLPIVQFADEEVQD